MKKIYYRIKFRLTSSMNIGSGKNDMTDRDLLRDSQGRPYIPGTTLAGIYRSLFTKKEAEVYFGKEVYEKTKDGIRIENNPKQSGVLIYDAVLQSEKFKVTSRDCVALDDYKTGIPGAKFDYEILEPGVSFVTYIEQNIRDENTETEDIGKRILKEWISGNIVIGSKVTRGLGWTEIESAEYAVFDFKNTEGNDLGRWLKFDMYGDAGWEAVIWDEIKCMDASESSMKICIHLKQKGGISIRKYTTAVNEKGKEQPDYEQMHYIREKDNEKLVYPVIPGTSWAGAFRHQIKKIMGDGVADVFGTCKKEADAENQQYKSKISFGESEITGCVSKQITRNAIDRFTNATVYGALYTERTYYGGETVLEIMLKKDVSEQFKDALAAAIVDLHMGFLAVGGLTAAGRGIFEITGIELDKRQLAVDLSDGAGLYQVLRGEM